MIELLRSFTANGLGVSATLDLVSTRKNKLFILLFLTQKELIYLCFELKTLHIGR
jgi:hypothetical protein